MKNKIILCAGGLFALLLIAFYTSGCKNTAHGAGKDIEHMGEKIQDKTE